MQCMTKTKSIRLPEALYEELAEFALYVSDKEGIKPSLSVPQIISRMKENSEEYEEYKKLEDKK